MLFADSVNVVGIHAVIFGTEKFKRNNVLRPTDFLERLKNFVEVDATCARPQSVFVEKCANREVFSVVQVHNENFLSVSLSKVADFGVHAVEVETVKRDADVVAVKLPE